MEITLEEIQKKFEGLPEDLKWAIMAANVDDKIIEIGQANNLNVDQMGQLSLETHMVMFGFVHPDKFEESITKSLGLPVEKIKKIVTEVNEKILKELREKVLEMYKKPEEKSEANTDNKEEDEIMNKAGIQINRGGIINNPSNTGAQARSTDSGQATPNKLLDSVRIPVIHTDHSLMNLTRSTDSGQALSTKPAQATNTPAPIVPKINTPTPSNMETQTPVAPKIMTDVKIATPETPTSYSKNKDPYRMSPDE